MPRPRLRDHLTWIAEPDGYLAELYEAVAQPTITTDGPVLRTAPNLDGDWWAALRRSLDTIAQVPTDRVAVRRTWTGPCPSLLVSRSTLGVPAWSTAHGDLHRPT
ncbi:hypothetical protein [Streptomyces chryseus]